MPNVQELFEVKSYMFSDHLTEVDTLLQNDWRICIGIKMVIRMVAG